MHVALRLDSAGAVPGEFLAESILNLCKVLEVLFPPEGGSGTVDAIRSGLKKLGYSELEIERDFVPAVALRNYIDVGHVFLGLFSQSELTILNTYVDHAYSKFQGMLERLLNKVAVGEFEIMPYEVGPAANKAKDIVRKMKASQEK